VIRTRLLMAVRGPRPTESPSQFAYGTIWRVEKLNTRLLASFLGAAMATTWAWIAVTAAIPSATAEPCSDVEVIFARGTGEAPGVGDTGQVFVDSLRTQTGAKSVSVYAVDYPASQDYANSIAAGAGDASAHAQSTAANCPNTRILLGGYSQGASVIDSITETMPPEVADHVGAVAVLGNPKSAYSASLAGGPLPAIGPLYAPKTIDLCVQDDPFCSEGGNWLAHDFYGFTGLTVKAAAFAAERL
jgi:cutinase